LVTTLLTAVFAGLFPALVNSQINLASALKQEGDRAGTAGRERHRAQAFLVAGQVALTSILLIGAGLLARSFQALQSVPLGFNPKHILTADIYLADKKYATPADCQAFRDALLARVRNLPGVSIAGASTGMPFGGNGNLNSFGIAGQPDTELSQAPLLYGEFISGDYFQTLGIPLLSGRLFSSQDGADQEKVVVINENLARRFFPGQNPIGKQIHDYFDLAGLKRNLYTIVGVVGNIQYGNPQSQQTPFEAYYPPIQNPTQMPVNNVTIAIRSEGDPRLLITSIKKIASELDPNLPVYNVGLLDDQVANAFTTERLASVVVGLFSGAALLLAAVGLYGVLSYSVVQRKREIGVRMALGAQSATILNLVIKQGLTVVGIGLLIGLLAALALSHLITNLLYEVSAVDYASIGLSVLILSLVSLIACLLPALRATRIDPLTALHE
jgi:predicted permease